MYVSYYINIVPSVGLYMPHGAGPRLAPVGRGPPHSLGAFCACSLPRGGAGKHATLRFARDFPWYTFPSSECYASVISRDMHFSISHFVFDSWPPPPRRLHRNRCSAMPGADAAAGADAGQAVILLYSYCTRKVNLRFTFLFPNLSFWTYSGFILNLL